MKNSILPMLLTIVLTTQRAEAQHGTASQAASGSARNTTTNFTPSHSSGYSSATSHGYNGATSNSRIESQASRPALSHVNIAEERHSGATNRGNTYSTSGGTFRDKNNLAGNHIDKNNYNINRGGFTSSTAMGATSTAAYGGYTGVTSSVKTDTSDHCQPWSPLMAWLIYRRNQRHGIYYALPPEYALSMFTPPPAFVAAVQEYVVTDKRSPDMYTFFDGYIVYCHDTAYGLINLTADGVYFDGGDLQLKVPYKHQGLKAVVLYNEQNEELYLKRIGNDKILSRVLHDGKLVVYDSYYSFDKSDFSYASLNAAYRGKEQRPLVMLDSRVHMIRTINRVYGSDLPTDYDWSAVVQHINTLD